MPILHKSTSQNYPSYIILANLKIYKTIIYQKKKAKCLCRIGKSKLQLIKRQKHAREFGLESGVSSHTPRMFSITCLRMIYKNLIVSFYRFFKSI